MIFQSTISKALTISGIGLHTGEQITMNLRPAEADSGVNFYRQTSDRNICIKACSANVIDTRLATVLEDSSWFDDQVSAAQITEAQKKSVFQPLWQMPERNWWAVLMISP